MFFLQTIAISNYTHSLRRFFHLLKTIVW